MPGYHTGPAAHLGVLLGARHSHLDNAGYSVDQKLTGDDPLDPRQMAETLVKEERWRQVLSSLVICFFARGIYTPDVVIRALGQAGFDLSPDDLSRIGEEALRRKYRFKTRHGFTFEQLRIPQRLCATPAAVGGWDETFLRQALDHARDLLSPDGASSS
jgi:aldehyde:ferredoxin oxidoreductase